MNIEPAKEGGGDDGLGAYLQHKTSRRNLLACLIDTDRRDGGVAGGTRGRSFPPTSVALLQTVGDDPPRVPGFIFSNCQNINPLVL